MVCKLELKDSCKLERMDVLNSLQWRHNERDDVSNYRRLDCLLNRLFRPRSRTASKLRVTGLCEGNLPVTGKFPAQRASNAENFPFDDVIMPNYIIISLHIFVEAKYYTIRITKCHRGRLNERQHVNVWTKSPTFYRQHFQMQWNWLYLKVFHPYLRLS